MIPEYILLAFFLFLLLHYIIFLFRIFNGLSNLKSPALGKIPDEFVSVIIPFRNEKENILTNLKSIENQNYPKEKYEVIYVNDLSDDDSNDLLNKNITMNNIIVKTVPNEFSINAHKKRAIRYAIENSIGEIIVTTDADCLYDNEWLKLLLMNFEPDVGFVSGAVEFFDNGKLFSKIQKIEFAGLVLTGAGLIGSGTPTICNAANIAYRKSVFDEVNGFKDNINLSSGDDEFLMQKISTDTNYRIRFSLEQKSIVKTSPNKNAKEFYHQRKRWASKGLFYADKNLVLKLIIIYLFYVGLIIQTIFAIILSPVFWLSLVVSVMSKLLVEYLILAKGKKIVLKNLSLTPFLITEILQVPYIIFAGFLGAFGNFIWKQRRINR